VNSIKAVTKSLLANNQQFVIHITNEYDYMFESESRKEIFDALKYVFHQLHGFNLPIYGVNDKLKDYATTKKDVVNGFEIPQKEEHRIRKEDIYEETKSPGTKASISTNASDEVADWNDEVQNSVSVNMYTKNDSKKNVTLADFVIQKVIGRGSFGKVFLV